jgi:hypothetical protein
MLSSYPDATGRKIVIRVVGKYALSPIAVQFFSEARKAALEVEADLQFQLGLRAASDADVAET